MSEDWRNDPRFKVSKKEDAKLKKEVKKFDKRILYFLLGAWVLWQLISRDMIQQKHEKIKKRKLKKGIFMMGAIGGILVIFALADFVLSWMGINLTPFLPPAIARFSPIIIGGIGALLLNMDNKKEQENENLRQFVAEGKKILAKQKKTKRAKKK